MVHGEIQCIHKVDCITDRRLPGKPVTNDSGRLDPATSIDRSIYCFVTDCQLSVSDFQSIRFWSEFCDACGFSSLGLCVSALDGINTVLGVALLTSDRTAE